MRYVSGETDRHTDKHVDRKTSHRYRAGKAIIAKLSDSFYILSALHHGQT